MKQIVVAILTCILVLSFMACRKEDPVENDNRSDAQSASQTHNSQSEKSPETATNSSSDTSEQRNEETENNTSRNPSEQELCIGVPLADPWGVYLSAKNVTPTGLTLECRRSAGDVVGELMTGSYYRIEYYESKSDEWIELTHDVENLAWTAEAWLIPEDSTTEWEVNWEFLYGSLEPGYYRIVKEIMDFKGAGDYIETQYSAEFEIED